jgi:hypothetical protein
MAKRKIDKKLRFEIMRAAMLMGYRRMTKGTGWAKPLGFTVLTVCPDRGRMEQWFWSISEENKLQLWNSEKIAKETDPLDQIKTFETHGIRTSVGNEIGHSADPITLHLEFCSPEEDVALFLQEKKALLQ